MKPSSAKQKGRLLQQYVGRRIRDLFGLSTNDVRSTSMGVSGIDIQLSDLARSRFPFAVECKSFARMAIYNLFRQAKENAKKEDLTPLLVVKQNHSNPLVIIDIDDFFNLLNENKNET